MSASQRFGALFLGLLCCSARGRAATPVVYSGTNADRAIADVVVAAGASLSDLKAVSLAEAVTGLPPSATGMAQVRPCGSSAIAAADVATHVAEAEKLVSYQDSAKAREVLSKAATELACLDSAVDPVLASRLFFLRGIAELGLGDKLAGWQAFSVANVFQPGMAWDEDFPPDFKATFAGAAGEVAAATPVALTVVPPLPRVTVDGRDVSAGSASLAPGPHLVQFPGSSVVGLWIELVAESPSTLAVPSATPPEAIDWAMDPARRPALDAVLAAKFGKGTSVYVVGGSGVWHGVLGEENLAKSSAAAVAPSPVTEAAPVAKAEHPRGTAFLWGGVAAMTVGGALWGVSYAQGSGATSEAQSAVAAMDRESWEAASERYEAASTRLVAGAVLTGVGAAGLLVAVAW